MFKKEKLEYVKVYLSSGKVIKGYYSKEDDDDYFEIYDAWNEGKKFITFRNCEVKTSEVQAIEWGN